MTDMQAIYQQINAWIEQSQGMEIEIGTGQKFAFVRYRSISSQELAQFPVQYPQAYQDFLVNVGEVELFIDNGLGIEFLAFEKIEVLSAEICQTWSNFYPQLLICLSMPALGWFAGFDLQQTILQNFSMFYSDVPIDLWLEEAEFQDFNTWLICLIESQHLI